jgi:hypothetical protein
VSDETAAWPLIEWLQLLAPFVAAGMTAFLGFLVYGNQKHVDRRERLIEEKRKAYVSFLAKLTEAKLEQLSTKSGMPTQDTYVALLNSAALVTLYAPDEMTRHVHDATDMINKNAGETKMTAGELAVLMKKDLLSRGQRK